MRVPQLIAADKDALIVVKVKHPLLGELEATKKLADLPGKKLAVER